jgi:hypothetical protein
MNRINQSIESNQNQSIAINQLVFVESGSFLPYLDYAVLSVVSCTLPAAKPSRLIRPGFVRVLSGSLRVYRKNPEFMESPENPE